ncbi:MAG: hypothetical protein E4H39_01950 [Syntrophobacterales bacterium]|nr:MAG: hypothetical protein E4H39_01950 [Syntrophobacterales bacterium]
MKEINVRLPGGTNAQHPSGKTVKEILSSWNDEALKSAVAAKINGSLVDLSFSVHEDSSIEPVDISSKDGLEVIRHSISHVMAQAVQDYSRALKLP